MALSLSFSSRPRAAQPQHPASQRTALHQFGDAMIANAQASGEPLTVLVFDQGDLPELHAIFGSAAARLLVAKFQQKLQALAGSRGMVLRTDPTTWTVLLPGLDRDAAVATAQRILGRSLAIEVECDGEDLLLIPRMAAHTVRREAAPMRDIYREMCERIARAQAFDLQREDYLRRERERHTRPAPLRATVAVPAYQ